MRPCTLCTGAPEYQARYHPDSAARCSPQRLMPWPFTGPIRRRLLDSPAKLREEKTIPSPPARSPAGSLKALLYGRFPSSHLVLKLRLLYPTQGKKSTPIYFLHPRNGSLIDVNRRLFHHKIKKRKNLKKGACQIRGLLL